MKNENLIFLKERLEERFKEMQVSVLQTNQLLVSAGKEQIMSALIFLKGEGYGHLALISCVDWIEKREFEIVYILSAYMGNDNKYTDKEKINVILKVRISRDKPKFPTITHIFKNAGHYERELHELFGINFEGNLELSPLFLTSEYRIPPFRKDFDTRKYVEDFFDKIPSIEEHQSTKHQGTSGEEE